MLTDILTLFSFIRGSYIGKYEKISYPIKYAVCSFKFSKRYERKSKFISGFNNLEQ